MAVINNRMVNKNSLDLVFHAMADATRRSILEEIANGSPTVGELGKPFDMSGPAISKHLKVLERAELVTRLKEGKVNRFRLNPERFEEAGAVLKELADSWLNRPEPVEEPAVAEVSVVVEDDEMWKY